VVHPQQDLDECGIGVKVTQSKGRYHVAQMVEGGPAAQTGQIFVGDFILQIDGISVFGKQQQEVMDLMFGPADTILEVEIERPSQPGKRHSVVVRRQLSPQKTKHQARSSRDRSPANAREENGADASQQAPEPAGMLETPKPMPAAPASSPDGQAQLPHNNIDMGRRFQASQAENGGGELSQLSWDPEDGYSTHSLSNSYDPSIKASGSPGRNNNARDKAPGTGGGVVSAADRLAAENLRLLTENQRLLTENKALKATIAELRVQLDREGGDSDSDDDDGDRSRRRRIVGSEQPEVSLDPSAWVGLGAPSEASFDPSVYGREPLWRELMDDEDWEEGGRGRGMDGGAKDADEMSEVSIDSIDPSERGGAGSNSDADGRAGGPDKCGIGVTLHRGEDSLLRIISITHGGPADLSVCCVACHTVNSKP
jgi:hypothetical protein